jgi:hypothetical protein
MWICLNDAFLSIVHKDCKPNELLVRARREGDIERVFGNHVIIVRSTDSDYLYRAVIETAEVAEAIDREVCSINYGNFKDSVRDPELHSAYLNIWEAMSRVQYPRPYSGGK